MTALSFKHHRHSPPTRTILHVIQGEYRVTGDPDIILTTTLGSCVAACLRDPHACVGGMNHFLLPRGTGHSPGDERRFGAHAMEVLINALLRAGARREHLEAKLFGGARLSEGLPDVGAQNAAFAREYLLREGINLKGGCLGGGHARRIQFWPVAGRIRQLGVPTLSGKMAAIESRPAETRVESNPVEFFDPGD